MKREKNKHQLIELYKMCKDLGIEPYDALEWKPGRMRINLEFYRIYTQWEIEKQEEAEAQAEAESEKG